MKLKLSFLVAEAAFEDAVVRLVAVGAENEAARALSRGAVLQLHQPAAVDLGAVVLKKCNKT